MRKYGRTYHLPISLGATSDDKVLASLNDLVDGEVVVTEKMDGENATIHARGAHARSPDGRRHPSRDWVKGFAADVTHALDEGERVVGENLYARHSIPYSALPSYFLGFAWIVGDEIKSWDETTARLDALGIEMVPVLYRGPYVDGLFERLAAALDPSFKEGFVVRATRAFPEREMATQMGKYVRANHVRTDVHWMNAPMVPNGLKAPG